MTGPAPTDVCCARISASCARTLASSPRILTSSNVAVDAISSTAAHPTANGHEIARTLGRGTAGGSEACSRRTREASSRNRRAHAGPARRDSGARTRSGPRATAGRANSGDELRLDNPNLLGELIVEQIAIFEAGLLVGRSLTQEVTDQLTIVEGLRGGGRLPRLPRALGRERRFAGAGGLQAAPYAALETVAEAKRARAQHVKRDRSFAAIALRASRCPPVCLPVSV